MKTQIELIKHFSTELQKVLISHGAESEYLTTAFYNLQAVKMGLPLPEVFKWTPIQVEKLKEQSLNICDPLATELQNAEDQYKCIGLSSGHLTESDKDLLDKLSREDYALVSMRESGWFIKLYDDDSENQKMYKNASESLKIIVSEVLKAKYRMIEFDCDALAYECFTVHSDV